MSVDHLPPAAAQFSTRVIRDHEEAASIARRAGLLGVLTNTPVGRTRYVAAVGYLTDRVALVVTFRKQGVVRERGFIAIVSTDEDGLVGLAEAVARLSAEGPS